MRGGQGKVGAADRLPAAMRSEGACQGQGRLPVALALTCPALALERRCRTGRLQWALRELWNHRGAIAPPRSGPFWLLRAGQRSAVGNWAICPNAIGECHAPHECRRPGCSKLSIYLFVAPLPRAPGAGRQRQSCLQLSRHSAERRASRLWRQGAPQSGSPVGGPGCQGGRPARLTWCADKDNSARRILA